MTAAVQVRSAGDVSFGSSNGLHARAVANTYFEKRDANGEIAKKVEAVEATFTEEQQAKFQEVEDKIAEADNLLTADQKKAWAEVDKLEDEASDKGAQGGK